MPRIIVQCLAGRTLDQKRQLVKGLTAAVVESFGVRPDQVTIFIEEATDEQYAKSGVLTVDSKASNR